MVNEVFTTRNLSVTRKTTGQSLIVLSGKSKAAVTNNKRLLKLTRWTLSISSHGLSTTAGLLVKMTVALLVCFVMCPNLPQLHDFLSKTFHVPSAAPPISIQSSPTIQSLPCIQKPRTIQSPPHLQSPGTIQSPPNIQSPPRLKSPGTIQSPPRLKSPHTIQSSISNCDQPSTSTSIDCVGSVPEDKDNDSQHSGGVSIFCIFHVLWVHLYLTQLW